MTPEAEKLFRLALNLFVPCICIHLFCIIKYCLVWITETPVREHASPSHQCVLDLF